ncbi:MAG: hypothetical protein OXU20_04640 [Myxococcales bacterium]|nr:hypothetical protein [Myxococcales bacterium]MDD9969676.1 hypothetical protein [Myxococcales bacterium]
MDVVASRRTPIEDEARFQRCGHLVLVLAIVSGSGACSRDDSRALKQLAPPSSPGHTAPGAQPQGFQGPATGPAPGSSDPRDDLGPPGTGMVWVTGTVNNLGGRQVRRREDVVEVCVYQQGDLPCRKTGDHGAFAIPVPQHMEAALVFRGDGLTPTLRAFVTADQPIELGNSRVANEVGVTRVAEGLDTKYKGDRAVVFFSGVPGVTAQVAGGDGVPFFIDRTGTLLKDQKSIPMFGTGGIMNVKPGVARVRFELAGGECAFGGDNTMSAWPDPKAPDVVRVPVAPGHHTHTVTMRCDKAKASAGQ